MQYLSKGFWKFSHDCKYDILNEPQHTHLIHAALRDKETAIEHNKDNSYTFYGRQEALLVIPQLFTTQLLLGFCRLVAG
jgi:hypothetical protein